MNPSTLRIATRKSALALWQAEHVAALLRAAHPGLKVELVPMSTRGDEILDQPLATIGGKGLFLKELEVAMLEGRAELAVHSLKDVPGPAGARFHVAGDTAACGRRRCFRQQRLRRPGRAAAGRAGRNLVVAPSGAAACAAAGSGLAATCAAMSVPDWASSMLATTTPSCWPVPDWSGWDWLHASRHGWPHRTGCRRRGRRPSRSRRATASPNMLALLAALDDADTRLTIRRRARDEPGAWAAVARCRSAPGACWANTACTCAAWSAMPAAVGCCTPKPAAQLIRPSTLGEQVAAALLAQGAGELLGH